MVSVDGPGHRRHHDRKVTGHRNAGTIKPDFIIVSLEQPSLSGIDLACAFNAMPITQDIPVALLTNHNMNRLVRNDGYG